MFLAEKHLELTSRQKSTNFRQICSTYDYLSKTAAKDACVQAMKVVEVASRE
jgi:hypothetical protein